MDLDFLRCCSDHSASLTELDSGDSESTGLSFDIECVRQAHEDGLISTEDRVFLVNLINLVETDPAVVERVIRIRNRMANGNLKLSQAEANELIVDLKCKSFDFTGLDISGLKFGREGLDLSKAVIGGDLKQSRVEVAGDLCQEFIEVGGDLYQDRIKIEGSIFQVHAVIRGGVIQVFARIGRDVMQEGMIIGSNLSQSCTTVGRNNNQSRVTVGRNNYQWAATIGGDNLQFDMVVGANIHQFEDGKGSSYQRDMWVSGNNDQRAKTVKSDLNMYGVLVGGDNLQYGAMIGGDLNLMNMTYVGRNLMFARKVKGSLNRQGFCRKSSKEDKGSRKKTEDSGLPSVDSVPVNSGVSRGPSAIGRGLEVGKREVAKVFELASEFATNFVRRND